MSVESKFMRQLDFYNPAQKPQAKALVVGAGG